MSNQTMPLEDSRQQRLTFLFVFAVLSVILIVSLLAAYLVQSAGKTNDILNGTQTIDQAYWSISKVEPNPSGDKLGYTVTVKSSIGNLRNYSNVQSFGLSNDRRHLVISVASNMDIVNLADDVHTKVNIPFAYSGDLGNVISWAPQDKFAAIAVMKDQNVNDTHVVVFNAQGTIIQDIKGNFTYVNANGINQVYPAKFSPTADLIATRVFKTEDVTIYSGGSQSYSVNQLPAYLAIYNAAGELRTEFPVRDADNANAKVIYIWSMDGNYIKFANIKGDAEVNYADDYLFTQQLVNLP